ncbi:MAG: hypothetical protein A2902_06895 [Elusimicrobia bacterium RIFCSPLOWO2_01_FULL_64_13]|nr:MAG: hypothetical protein A2636_04120 [Elusimicrobia bacterium RIFCSPHIGHO2_01_FULL_64_10]OGR97461.1 MAG: hypothetical protein A2902_06895 [Elusimicrobia bacterium RIFCSPLOWO2_01_FULL_64_13]
MTRNVGAADGVVRIVTAVAGFVVAAALLSACGKPEGPPSSSSPLSRQEMAAKFPADLGPATVDVSAYPREVQDGYRVFLAVCSSCHSTARPLNSSLTSAFDWKRFVQRMHVKVEDRGYHLEKPDMKKILDFLVYDAAARKVKGRKDFEARQKELNGLFNDMVRERERLISEETKNLPKKETPYVGVK